jgi:hypothetical protein
MSRHQNDDCGRLRHDMDLRFDAYESRLQELSRKYFHAWIQVHTWSRRDEEITNMDTPTVVAYNSKLKLFFSIIIFNTCDEWMLHHDIYSMSFTEVLTMIKEGVDHAWKGWIMKHLNWGPNTSAPYASTRSPRYLWYKETRRPHLILFGNVDSDSRNSPY